MKKIKELKRELQLERCKENPNTSKITKLTKEIQEKRNKNA